MIHLVLGGARSGKSSFAESSVLQQAQAEKIKPLYVATATAFDNEMAKRIAKHQKDRSNHWQLHECPNDLVQLIASFKHRQVVLVDCLTLWLNNLIYDKEQQLMAKGAEVRKDLIEQHVSSAIDELVSCLAEHSMQSTMQITLVSNEVGLGVIPLGEQTRLFVDYCGWLNQAIAQLADKVTLVTAGIPMQIKRQNSSASPDVLGE